MRDHRAALLNCRTQSYQHLFHNRVAIDAPGTIPAYSRKGQQILNQGLHAQSSLAGIADEFVGVLVEFAAIALRKQLRIGRDHAQRLLQVMRCHISELFQVRVGAG